MKIAGFATGPFQTNCYVLINEHDSEAVVIDPGYGAYERVNAMLAEEGVRPAAVVLTHGHIDHTRDAAAFAVETFLHPADHFMLDRGAGLSEETLRLHDAQHMAPVDHLTDLEEGPLEVAGIRFTATHAPGHSPGCVMLETEEVVFTGDVLFKGSIGRTDFDHSDHGAMMASLRGPVWRLDDALTVLPGHGPATTMGQERATNPFLLQANAGR